MKKTVHEYTLTVPESDIDEYNHANNVAYIRWMQDTALDHLASAGWPSKKMLAANFGIIARSHFIRYLKPAFAGDEILAQTWLEDWRKVRGVRKFKFIRKSDNAVIATAETEWVSIKVSNGRPIKLPDEIAEAFEMVSIL